MSPTDCLRGQGNYLGDHTECGLLGCAGVIQACCRDGQCANLSEQVCASHGGTPQGLGSNCDNTVCAPTAGACCTNEGCRRVNPDTCAAANGSFYGPGTNCDHPAICNGRCCLPNAECKLITREECLDQAHGIFWAQGVDCEGSPCPPTGACCRGPDDCFITGRQLCVEIHQGNYGGDGSDCASGCFEGCCGPEGQCREMPVDECRAIGGTRLGPGSRCAGDHNNNNLDDACEPQKPCTECGPGPHWVDDCFGGNDNLPSGALVGIDLNGDCVADTSVVLGGPVIVHRSDPRDDSAQFPGLRTMDTHMDVMDTEMLSLNLTGGGMSLVAGVGYGHTPLRHTRGAIAEQLVDPTMADSFFDVFFEMDLGGGQLVYNHQPLRVESELTCLPPNANYIHPTGCLPLFSAPDGGEFVANLVSANHFTYPGCCFGTTCVEIPPDVCKAQAGKVVPDCLGDANHNKIDDACEREACEPTEDHSACREVTCPSDVAKCRAKCARFDPLTGRVGVEACDCERDDECHVELVNRPTVAGIASECTVPDDGSGTATLPPPGCPYLSPDQVHMIIDGLPAGTTIQLGIIHQQFICKQGSAGVCSFSDVDCTQFGGSLGGEKECRLSSLSMNLDGTGALGGFHRLLNFPMAVETHIGPRMRGDVVQSFDTDMFRMFGQIPIGDPDFDLLRIAAGSDFCLPSPGHTTLARLPGGDWAVDSFFDITYRIDFIGHPGGALGGMSGSTTGTIRMQTFTPFKCRGGCGEQNVCEGRRTVNTDGTITLCCGCAPKPVEACCLPQGLCKEIPPEDCHSEGGQRLGVGSHCKGDADGNGRDDACERDKPCSECGPGPHWVDTCDGGTDSMPSGALLGIDTNLDCVADTSLVLNGPVIVGRTGSRDDSAQFPGLRPIDGHQDVIDTEMLSLDLTGGGVTLVAGAGNAHVPIRPTRGAILEDTSDASLADSFFDVFVELDMGGGHFVYNHDPLTVKSEGLTCLPPITSYLHPTGCLPLFSEPVGGVHVANLVSARDDTYPTGACCFRGGRCLDLPPDVCEQEHGRPRPRGTTCADTICPRPGDLDHDGDVDLHDHKLFLECLKGPHIPVSGDCEEADLDGDGDVDMMDVGSFFDIFVGD